jgi:hypothetical protein
VGERLGGDLVGRHLDVLVQAAAVSRSTVTGSATADDGLHRGTEPTGGQDPRVDAARQLADLLHPSFA